MSRRRLAALLTAAALAAGCESVLKTTIHANPKADFSRYKTFHVNGTRIETDGQYYIRQEITKRIEQKGLTVADKNPDLVVISDVIRDSAMKPEQTYDTSWWTGSASSEPTGMPPIGALVIDITDPVSNQLVWRAVAKGTVPKSGLLRRTKVQVALDRLFADFPPKTPSK